MPAVGVDRGATRGTATEVALEPAAMCASGVLLMRQQCAHERVTHDVGIRDMRTLNQPERTTAADVLVVPVKTRTARMNSVPRHL